MAGTEPAPTAVMGRVLARLFVELADLIELEGSDPRRSVAYRRAALSLRDAAEPVEVLVAEGRIRTLPGIGPTLAAKIAEFSRSGAIAALEELRAAVPAGVAGLLRVRGVGPKLASAAWHELGVTSIEGLRDAAADGRLAVLPGVGRARARRVLLAAEAALSPLRLLGEVLPVAEALARATGVERAAVAGEARRGCPLIHEGVRLVAAGPAEAVAAALAAAVADWGEAPRAEDALVRAVLPDGLPVRIDCCAAGQFGTALVLATGSAAHLEAMGAPAATAEEEGVYAAAGLPWIPPELREDGREVAAAAAGTLPPRLVEEGDLQGDLHCHSTYSDGMASPEAMAAAARARGYRYLALADHSRSLVVAHGMSIDALRERGRRIAAYNAAHPEGPRLLQAAEVEILRDGSLDYPDEVLAELDFVVASMHNGHGQSAAQLTERSLRALAHPAVDLLGHPTGRRLGRREPFPVDVPVLIEAAARFGKALEVNGSPERLDLDAGHARALPAAGVAACLDSDAHSVEGLASTRYAAITARRAGLRREDVLNTRPLEEVVARRRTPRTG